VRPVRRRMRLWCAARISARWRACGARRPPLSTPDRPGAFEARPQRLASHNPIRASKAGSPRPRRQLPGSRPHRALIGASSGGGTDELLAWLTKPGRRYGAWPIPFTITGIVSEAGGLLLTQALRVTGRDRPGGAATTVAACGRCMARGRSSRIWRVALALGGDCLADVAMLRAQPDLFGPLASGPVVSRLLTCLAPSA
jgi:hypothetical protein